MLSGIPKSHIFHRILGTHASVAANHTRHRRPNIKPSELAKQWRIRLDTASKTLKATTQASI